MIKTLKEQINIDREIENIRKKLALRPDFNLLDAFRIIDQNEKGFVSSNQFERALQHLEINTNKNHIYLFFRTHDKDLDGLIRFFN